MKTPTNNYLNFLKLNTSRFRGQWIVLVGKKVIAHGKKADLAYKQALKKYPNDKISLAKIPAGDALILCFLSNTKKK